MALIFYFSSQTGDDLNSFMLFFHRFFPGMESFDWGHFVAYFGLALTLLWGYGSNYLNWRGKLLIVILCSLYGVTDEFHQSFVGDRTPDIKDLRNDTIGASLAMLLVSIRSVEKRVSRFLTVKKY
jgi:VanZ family protein